MFDKQLLNRSIKCLSFKIGLPQIRGQIRQASRRLSTVQSKLYERPYRGTTPSPKEIMHGRIGTHPCVELAMGSILGAIIYRGNQLVYDNYSNSACQLPPPPCLHQKVCSITNRSIHRTERVRIWAHIHKNAQNPSNISRFALSGDPTGACHIGNQPLCFHQMGLNKVISAQERILTSIMWLPDHKSDLN